MSESMAEDLVEFERLLEDYTQAVMDFQIAGGDEFLNWFEYRWLLLLQSELVNLYDEAIHYDCVNLGAFLTRGGVPRC